MWFVCCLISISALALAELTQQKLLNRKNAFNEQTSGVLTFLVQSLLTVPIVILFFRSELLAVFHLTIVLKIILVSLLASIGMRFYLRSFKVKNISLSSVFGSSSVFVSTTLGIIFFHESVMPLKFLGLAAILIAVISLNIRNTSLEKNHYFSLLAAIIFGVTFTLDKNIVSSIHPLIYIFWSFTFVALWGFIISPKVIMHSLQHKELSDYQPIILSAFGYLIFNIATFYAYRFGGEVGRVDAINNSQVFLIILFEFFVLKQHTHIWRKIITAFIAFSGVLILGFI